MRAKTQQVPAMMSAVVVTWVVAAVLVALVDQTIAAPVPSVIVKTFAIIAVGFGYMRLMARDASLDHALFVGVTWLLLAIITEIVLARHFHHTWFELLGSPDSALRNILLFAWITAPALFARRIE